MVIRCSADLMWRVAIKGLNDVEWPTDLTLHIFFHSSLCKSEWR